MKPFRLPLAILFLLLVHSTLLRAAALTIAWNPNSEPDIAGYRVQYGTSSGTYTNEVDAGNATLKTIANLTSGIRYYFIVLAYNTAGEESAPSTEVSAIAGTAPTPTPTPTPGGSPTPTPSPTPPPQYILNLSTRVQVRTGDDVLIGGFIVKGDLDKSIVIRALGPSLSVLGVKHPLANPVLDLYDATGTLVEENNDWSSLPPGTVPTDLQPQSSLESVIVRTLLPGTYTAVLRSADSSTDRKSVV